jgi:hypothetical protein
VSRKDAEQQAAAEQAKLDNLMVIMHAEGTVASARIADLAAAQKTAWRRVPAMKGQVTRAEKDGSASKIAAAQARYDAARREADALADAGIKEMAAIMDQGHENLGAVLDQITPTWDAQSRALRAAIDPGNGPEIEP